MKLGQKFGSLPEKKFGGPRTSKFGPNFGQLRNFIANISGIKQDIVKWKMMLQTATRLPTFKQRLKTELFIRCNDLPSSYARKHSVSRLKLFSVLLLHNSLVVGLTGGLIQESCAIAKMTAQCALHMGALKIFGTA